MTTATLADAPDIATLTDTIDHAPPLLRAIAHARRLALRHLEAPAGESWQAIAEGQARLATECLEALAALVAALDPTPTR